MTPDKLLTVVEDAFGIDRYDICVKSRKRKYSIPRMAAVVAARWYSKKMFRKVAYYCGMSMPNAYTAEARLAKAAKKDPKIMAVLYHIARAVSNDEEE